MKNAFTLVCIFLGSQVPCLDIPGCGELQNIKWDTSCMLSSKKRLHDLNNFVLSIQNLLLLDGKFYYIVPPKSPETYKNRVKAELMRMTNNEIDFKVADVAHSPLKQLKVVKEVKNYEATVVFQKANMKRFSHPQLIGAELKYVSIGHLYNLMIRLFQDFKTFGSYRNSTIFLTTVMHQSHLDWETGASINCFSQDGILHVETTKSKNNTLYILRNVIIYLPNHNKHNKLITQQLPQDVYNYCKNNGFAYDSSGEIQDRKKYNVSIGSVFKNEAQYLLEWIAYHTIIGVDHFYLFDNESTDEFMEVLQPLIELNLVTIFNRSNTFLYPHWFFQQSFLKFLGEKYSFETKWFLTVDIDEFLVIKDPKYNNSINQFIQQNQLMRSETGSLQIGRESFAGNYDPIEKSQLVTNKLTYKVGPQDDQDFKPLVSTNGLDHVYIHWGYTYAPIRNVEMDNNCSIQSKFNQHKRDYMDCVVTNPLSVFHYVVKNYDRCIAKMTPYKGQTSNWRIIEGEAYCKKMVDGYKISPSKWSRDLTLLNMTNQICDRMKLLNENWYNKNQICQDYD